MNSLGKVLSLVLVLVFLSSVVTFQSATVRAQSKIIVVPDDYPTIQAAINAANSEDTILVNPGTYYEHVTVNKPLTLLGENKSTTIIDGSYSGNPVSVNANNVTITNFTIQNSGWNLQWGAVYISGNSFNVTIADNNIVNNEYGVLADPGSIARISNNFISGNQTYNLDNWDTAGILLFSNYCTAKSNLIQQVNFGIMIHGNYNLIDNNTFLGSFQYNNGNFNGSSYGIGILVNKRLSLYAFQDSINNTVTGNTIEGWDFQLDLGGIDGWVFLQNNIFGGFSTGRIGTNIWDNGYPAGGNYWSGYTGIDANSDGIGDTPYVINSINKDNFPLMSPTAIPVPILVPTPIPTPTPSTAPITGTTDNGTIVNFTFKGNITVEQISNLTIATNQSAKTTTVSFTVTGENGTAGFSNITIPMSLVCNGTIPTIYIDNQPAENQSYTQDSNNYYLWFTTHFSTHQVSIEFVATTPTPIPTSTTSASGLQNTVFLGLDWVQLAILIVMSIVVVAVVVVAFLFLSKKA